MAACNSISLVLMRRRETKGLRVLEYFDTSVRTNREFERTVRLALRKEFAYLSSPVTRRESPWMGWVISECSFEAICDYERTNERPIQPLNPTVLSYRRWKVSFAHAAMGEDV